MKRQDERGNDVDLGRWRTLPLPAIEGLPGRVMVRSQSLPPHSIFPIHAHAWNQLAYATSGTLTVVVERTWYLVTSEQAIWIPTHVQHSTGSLNGSEFRSLYVAETAALPKICTVFSVTELLRALIIELTEAERRREQDAYITRLQDLIVDQLQRLEPHRFCLPWPKSNSLQRICEKLYGAPDDPDGIDTLSTSFGMSPRTLMRRFNDEVGIGLREWRSRLRLFRALEWLDAGRSVTDVALGLGYATPSAFSHMFRKEMGCSPTEWEKRRSAFAGTKRAETSPHAMKKA